jgi:GMP synthase-like glutamine amidotransferase
MYWYFSSLSSSFLPLPKTISLIGDRQNIFQMHRDMVMELPEGVENLGQTDICAIHGMYAQRRLISVQGHPEHTSDISREILDMRRKMGIFSDETYREMIGRVDREHDGVVVGVAVIKFLQE